MKPSQRRSGLSLLEVMIAMALVGILAALLFALLGRASKQLHTDQVMAQIEDMGRAALDQIGRDLRLTKSDRLTDVGTGAVIVPDNAKLYRAIRFVIPSREFNLQTYRASGADQLFDRTVTYAWAPSPGITSAAPAETDRNGADENKDGLVDNGDLVRTETGKDNQTGATKTVTTRIVRDLRAWDHPYPGGYPPALDTDEKKRSINGLWFRVPATTPQGMDCRGIVEVHFIIERLDPSTSKGSSKLLGRTFTTTIDLRN